ncbi:MAG: transposase [Clostridia bacterium]|uniref:Transposase-like protein DUF772 n=2 Tax=Faecalimonas umbilicata TaxID=1912855 RepID=A0A4R3JQ99_9FIRM|nr:transposase [Faecalimonas umbilicata]MDY2761809.1 transposase [Faecalimonas umbilicata]TCS67886.1 transposase-like protein DUF772 [Faecalimonas umbilicata]
MAYIVGTDRYQTRMITTSLDDLISKDNSVRVIDSYVESLDLENLGFIEYSGRNRGQSPYRRSDLLKLHIYGYLNKIRSSRALETEAKRNLELMWLVNCITPDHGTIKADDIMPSVQYHMNTTVYEIRYVKLTAFLLILFRSKDLPGRISDKYLLSIFAKTMSLSFSLKN